MIVIKVEIWPYGDESKAKHEGTVVIFNDLSGTESKGNYEYAISKWGRPTHIWKRGTIDNFSRKRDNVWKLMQQVFGKLDNKEDSRSERLMNMPMENEK